MSRPLLVFLGLAAGVTVVASLASVPLAGQTRSPAVESTWTVPRTPSGHPDLQGVWTTDAEVSVPLERPPEFGERAFLTDEELAKRDALEKMLARDEKGERPPARLGPVGDGPEHWFEWGKKPSARTSLVTDPPDGRIPAFTPEAQKRVVDSRRVVGLGADAGSSGRRPINGPEDVNLAERCLTRGLPTTWFPQVYNNGFQIVQGPGYVAIVYERLHETRIVPMDGRPHLGESLRQWLGDSRGHWEGETLVIDVTNFSDKTSFRRSSETLHLVERYTRIDAETIRVDITVQDPTTWTKPWTIAVTGKKDPKYSMIYEYACHEGNYAMANMLSAARAQEKAAEDAAKKE